MNELIEPPIQQTNDEITVRFCFVDGDTYSQKVFMKQADLIEELLEWFRDKKGKPTWSWNYSPISKITVLSRSHIMSIEIDGYIELTRTKQKWYEKIWDKVRTYLVFRRLKGGEAIEKGDEIQREGNATET